MGKSSNEYANDILDYLKSHGYTSPNGYWMRTKSLAYNLDIPDTSQDTLLKVLERLRLIGAIERGRASYGHRGFAWRVKVESWNRGNPFVPTGMAATANIPPAPVMRPVTKPDSEELASLKARVSDLETTVQELQTQEGQVVKTLEVKRWDGKITSLDDVVLPKVFDKILALAGCRRNILLVGPAGCGKSHVAQLVADSLDLPFGSISCTSGMSEAHLLGRAVPDLTHGKNRHQTCDFLERYEKGGVFLLDELDAADPNLLLAINTALANGYCNVPNRPDKPRAEQHQDFIPIATANTFGKGATRMYSGRNQLDESTIDRFRIGIVECGYDHAVERALCPDDGLRYVLQRIREKIEASGLRRIMSTRFIRDAYVMKEGAGWSAREILDTFFEGWTPEEKAKVYP